MLAPSEHCLAAPAAIAVEIKEAEVEAEQDTPLRAHQQEQIRDNAPASKPNSADPDITVIQFEEIQTPQDNAEGEKADPDYSTEPESPSFREIELDEENGEKSSAVEDEMEEKTEDQLIPMYNEDAKEVHTGELILLQQAEQRTCGTAGASPEPLSKEIAKESNNGIKDVAFENPNKKLEVAIAEHSSEDVEVVEILNNLEEQTTPEPETVENGTVKSSFVLLNLNEGCNDPLEEQSDSEEDCSDTECSTQLVTTRGPPDNPELQKIREEQIRKWLIFEQKCSSEKPNENAIVLASNQLTSPGRLSPNDMKGEILQHPEYIGSDQYTEGNGAQQAEGCEANSELMVNGVDGMARRVRFLTDQEGNLLVSVFMSNVQAISTSEEASIPNKCSGTADANLQNPSLVVSPPSLEPATTEPTSKLQKDIGETLDTFILLTPCPLKQPPPGKPPDPPSQYEDEGCNSSDETLSVSSCASMIEIVPESSQALTASKQPDGSSRLSIEPVADAENNGVNIEVLMEHPLEVISEHRELLEIAEEETGSDTSSSQPPSFIVHEPILYNSGCPEALIDLPETSSEPVRSFPNIDENKNTVTNVGENLAMGPKFGPEMYPNVMPELRQSTISSSSEDGELDEIISTQGDIPAVPPTTTAFSNGVVVCEAEQEQQMTSLCIQEEHISAVALTIAKWESMSKAQSTENLNASSSSISGHLPVAKTSSSPCPTKAHKPLTGTLSAMPVLQMAPVPILTSQQVIGNEIGNTNSKSIQIYEDKTPKENQGNVAKSTIAAAFPANRQSSNNSSSNVEQLILGKAPGWNCWGREVKSSEQNVHNANSKRDVNDGEDVIYAQPNQAGNLITSIANPSTILKTHPKPLSKGEIVNWLKEGEIHRAGLLINYGQTNHHVSVIAGPNITTPALVSWFFGLVSRQQAEKYLYGQPTGTFLIRISTRIWGYTLSYQASSGRTKHFLISATNPAVPATLKVVTDCTPPTPQTGKQQRMSPFLPPQGRYAFIGTNMTPYGSLVSLIRHHSHAPITKLGGEKLLNPCPGGPQVAGLDFLFK